MKFIQEVDKRTSSIQVVAPHQTIFLKMLLQALKKFKTTIKSTEIAPENYDEHDVYFFIQYPHVLLPQFADKTDQRFIFIVFNMDEMAQTLSSFAYAHQLHHIKIINLQTHPDFYQKDIDTILWFAFSNPEDIFLHIYHPELELKHTPSPKIEKKHKKALTLPRTKRGWALIIFLFFLLSNTAFIPPLLAGSYLNYKYANAVIQNQTNQSPFSAELTLSIARMLYGYSSPTYHLFSIARPFDDLFELNSATNRIVIAGSELKKDGALFLQFMMMKNKTSTEIEETRQIKKRVFSNIRIIQEDIRILEQKIPKREEFKKTTQMLEEYNDIIPLISELEPHIDTFFPSEGEKKYLLLFANNMELRPGGGFIGSFAILTVGPYEVKNIQMYDVYDADGQLTEHIAPPAAISKFLEQPFWFVRDSAFTPDFVTNFGEAEKLLEKEINEGNFAGGMLFTTTAIQNILEASNGLYIPDYNETITKDNFYLKAQLYAEKDFFPGSIQKKRFLGSVMNQMFINIGTVSPATLVKQLEKSLNEKQIVAYSRDRDIQQYLEKNYWSGRTLKPKCNLPQAINCILDYIFPVDANLGVNKANFFVSRPTKMEVHINENGLIRNTITLAYSNNAYEDIFPGGPYKNYFQLFIPPNSQVEQITVDDTLMTDYDETNFEYKTVGFLLTVPPRESKIVKITYTLPTRIIGGNGMYQMIFQKQIGSANDNLQLEFDLPDNISMVNNNFSPLVKGNKIIYNTSISSDKIFLIEFSKN